MRVRSVLVATWLVFAVLATAAGFAAVSQVGRELDVQPLPAAAPRAEPTESFATVGPTDPSAGATSPGSPSSDSSGQTRAPTRTRTTSADVPDLPEPPRSRTASRVVRGNYVSATCRSGAVTLSASPAPGWRLDDYRPGPAREARARFRSESGDVEVRVTCGSGGAPAFDVRDDGGSGSDDD
jgi:hypothetical protein